jgi:hypothetical protein
MHLGAGSGGCPCIVGLEQARASHLRTTNPTHASIQKDSRSEHACTQVLPVLTHPAPCNPMQQLPSMHARMHAKLSQKCRSLTGSYCAQLVVQVSEDKRQKVIATIAKYVCLVPPGQVRYTAYASSDINCIRLQGLQPQTCQMHATLYAACEAVPLGCDIMQHGVATITACPQHAWLTVHAQVQTSRTRVAKAGPAHCPCSQDSRQTGLVWDACGTWLARRNVRCVVLALAQDLFWCSHLQLPVIETCIGHVWSECTGAAALPVVLWIATRPTL